MVQIVTPLLYLGLIGLATALPSSLITRQNPPPITRQSYTSCLSLSSSCNRYKADLSNFYNYTSCFLLTACLQGIVTPAQVLNGTEAPATQPRLTESAFFSMSNGNSYMTQQNYIDSYYHEISITPGGEYPDDPTILIDQWETIAAWTGFCDTKNIPYQNLADWLEYSGTPGVYPSVMSCNPTVPVVAPAPQPSTYN